MHEIASSFFNIFVDVPRLYFILKILVAEDIILMVVTGIIVDNPLEGVCSYGKE